VKRTIFSNDTLKQQVARIPQIVDNGTDGLGCIETATEPPAKKRKA
jgi:hypothetical protein